MTARQFSFLQEMLAQYDLPYGWGFKGLPGEPYVGRDCSGFVTSALFLSGGQDLRATHNAQRMWDEFDEADVPCIGVICLYGKPQRVQHVMAWLTDGVVIGSYNGNSSITTEQLAQDNDAKVGLRHGYQYRSDFLGFKTLPEILIP